MTALPLADHLTNECKKSTKDRTIKVQYGNGYKQVAMDGLHSVVEIWELHYMPLEGTNLTTVKEFLNEVKCSGQITWTPFGESVSKKWRRVEDSLREDLFTTSLVKISFTLEQDFS